LFGKNGPASRLRDILAAEHESIRNSSDLVDSAIEETCSKIPVIGDGGTGTPIGASVLGDAFG
jgi:hypothetical protein